MSNRSWVTDNRGFPSWYKGRMRHDAITDSWAGEREGKFTKQRGLLILNKNRDFVTDEERQNAINRRKR